MTDNTVARQEFEAWLETGLDGEAANFSRWEQAVAWLAWQAATERDRDAIPHHAARSSSGAVYHHVAGLRELAEAATPGEWRYDYEVGFCGELVSSTERVLATFADEPDAADAAHIAAANPSTILALLDRLEAAERVQAEAIQALDRKLSQWGKKKNQTFGKDDEAHRVARQVQDVLFGVRMQIDAARREG